MSKKPQYDPEEIRYPDQKIVESPLVPEMENSYIEYAMSVIVGRALPDVRDGLKPVHRRILYAMYEDNLTSDKPFKKSATCVGDVLGRYHPHGDASVYDALVRLAQDFSMRYMLVDGHGNFGSVDGDPPAAYRYTEARLSKISDEMLRDIEKDTVDWDPNFDESRKEPRVLPARFPNLLVNGSSGIAVGMATNIPPHNLKEVINACICVLDDPECTLANLMEHITGPDFPTGGIIMGRSGIRAAYATGRGKVVVRAKTEFEEFGKDRTRIIVTELPYQVNKRQLIKTIADQVKDKRIDGISDLRDETDRNGMRMVIELKKDAIPEIIRNKLFSYTQLQDTVGVTMLALVNGEPKVLNLKQMLEEYLNFQVEVVTKRTLYDLNKCKNRAHVLQGFALAIDYIDEVIDILRSSKNVAEGKQRLMERFKDTDMSTLLDRAQYPYANKIEIGVGLTDVQAEAIVQMRLGQLTGLEREKIMDELEQICGRIAELEELLEDRSKMYGVIREELEVIRKKFGDDRRTQIETISGEVDIEDLIPVEDSVVTYTHNGYIKRAPVDTYKTQKRGGKGVSGMKQREEDFVEELFIASTHDHLLFISNKGLMYRLKCYEITEGSKASRGVNLVNLLPLAEGEKIAAMLKTTDFEDDKFVVIVTKNGKIKRTPLSAYRNVRKNGLIAIGLDDGDEIAAVRMTDGSSQLMVATRNGMTLRMEESCIRQMSRSAHGVRAIHLREEDQVVSMARVREGATVLTVTEQGFGRRTELDAYRLQNRGGYGLSNYKVDAERGYVCGIKVVDEADDIILIASDGIIIRIRTSDIRIMSRYAKGVRVMRVSEDAKVVTFTRAEHDDSAEIQSVEQLSEEELQAQQADAAAAEKNEVIPEDSGEEAEE